MAQYEFTGTVKVINPVQTFASGFSKRELVVTSEEERYPQDIAFEFVKDKMSLLDGIQEGDRVKVMFDLRGREYNGRYFVGVSGWKVDKVDGAASVPAAAAAADEAMPGGVAGMTPDDLADGMPF